MSVIPARLFLFSFLLGCFLGWLQQFSELSSCNIFVQIAVFSRFCESSQLDRSFNAVAYGI